MLHFACCTWHRGQAADTCCIWKAACSASCLPDMALVHQSQVDPTLLQGGNDHEIFESPKTIGHTVTSPIDTVEQCTELFIKPHSGNITGSAVQAAVEKVLTNGQ